MRPGPLPAQQMKNPLTRKTQKETLLANTLQTADHVIIIGQLPNGLSKANHNGGSDGELVAVGLFYCLPHQ